MYRCNQETEVLLLLLFFFSLFHESGSALFSPSASGTASVSYSLIRVPYDLGKHIRINTIIYSALDLHSGTDINISVATGGGKQLIWWKFGSFSINSPCTVCRARKLCGWSAAAPTWWEYKLLAYLLPSSARTNQ